MSTAGAPTLPMNSGEIVESYLCLSVRREANEGATAHILSTTTSQGGSFASFVGVSACFMAVLDF